MLAMSARQAPKDPTRCEMMGLTEAVHMVSLEEAGNAEDAGTLELECKGKEGGSRRAWGDLDCGKEIMKAEM